MDSLHHFFSWLFSGTHPYSRQLCNILWVYLMSGWCLEAPALWLKCCAWQSEHTVLSLFISSVCVDMATSSLVLLTWVIFIVPISTLPACWVGLEDLSKPTSARQHVYCRGLFTQTCRRPLSGSNISLFFPFFFLRALAEIVFVLHSEGVQLHSQLPRMPRWHLPMLGRSEKM